MTIEKIESRTANSAYPKVAVSCPVVTFWVNEKAYTALNFLLKIAIFAKPETVMR
jgi:hypothetical protein